MVKPRQLVLSVHDYFLRKFEEGRAGTTSDIGSPATAKLDNISDAWALDHINITRLQPLIEALDEDTSGSVSISEVNKFTMSRPDGWR